MKSPWFSGLCLNSSSISILCFIPCLFDWKKTCRRKSRRRKWSRNWKWLIIQSWLIIKMKPTFIFFVKIYLKSWFRDDWIRSEYHSNFTRVDVIVSVFSNKFVKFNRISTFIPNIAKKMSGSEVGKLHEKM